MRQTPEAVQPHLAERLCWQAACRDEARMAQRLYHKPVVDGVYQLDEGALLEDFFSCLQELGVGNWRGDIQATAIPRAMVPIVQDVLLDGLKTLWGIESLPALPAFLRDEALMRLLGFNAQQAHEVCQRGAAKRPGPRTTGPICSEALADHLAKVHMRDLEAILNNVIRALAQAGICTANITGLVDATDLETTAA